MSTPAKNCLIYLATTFVLIVAGIATHEPVFAIPAAMAAFVAGICAVPSGAR